MNQSFYRTLDKEVLDLVGGALKDASNIDNSTWLDKLFPDGFGTSADLAVLRKIDGDGRYILQETGISLDDIAGLDIILDQQNQAIAGKQDKLDFIPADAADTYTKDEVDAAFDALPDSPAVPTFATVAEIRAGKTVGKIIDPQTMADALAPVVITRAAAAVGMDFDSFINCNIPLDANVTLGPPSGGYPGKSGFLTLSQNPTGGWLAALPSQYKLPDGGITQKTTANGKTRIPYVIGGSLEVVLWPTTKWSA